MKPMRVNKGKAAMTGILFVLFLCSLLISFNQAMERKAGSRFQ